MQGLRYFKSEYACIAFYIFFCFQNMRNKQTDIGGFADYAKNVAQYKRNQRVFQERMEYIKSLFEVDIGYLTDIMPFVFVMTETTKSAKNM